jgi:putative nucleotidyltransferase with HDIG domain
MTEVATASVMKLDLATLQQRIAALPALPKAAAEAIAALRDDDSSAEDCARCIGRDPALTARVLRLANSAFYGVPGRVASIQGAIQMLGRRTLGTALTAAAVTSQFSGLQCEGFHFDAFWRHALATAITAEAIARLRVLDEEMAFTAGLLHDIGRLALAAHFPQQMTHVLALAQARDAWAIDVEREVLATDHAQIGVAIASHWHFPAEVQAAIAAHHQPVASAVATIADVVHVADAIVHALDIAGDPHEAVPEVDLAAWARVALTPEQSLSLFECTEEGVAVLCSALAN